MVQLLLYLMFVISSTMGLDDVAPLFAENAAEECLFCASHDDSKNDQDPSDVNGPDEYPVLHYFTPLHTNFYADVFTEISQHHPKLHLNTAYAIRAPPRVFSNNS